jgi:chromosome segregation ATPase
LLLHQLEEVKTSLKAVQTERDQAKAASDGLAQELAAKMSANKQLETEASVLHAKVMDLKSRVRVHACVASFCCFMTLAWVCVG